MKNLFLLLLAVFSGSYLGAQTNNNSTETDIAAYVANSSTTQMPTKVPVNTESSGSFYLYKDWKNRGVIYLKNKTTLKLNSLNYNTFTDMFEAKVSADSSFSFSRESTDSIALNNKIFKVLPKSGSEVNGYVEILSDENNMLFIKKYSSVLEKAKPNALSGNYDFPDKIVVEENYYIKRDYGFVPVSLNKRSLVKLFNSYEKEVKQFVNENKLSFKKESDVVSIVKFVSEISK